MQRGIRDTRPFGTVGRAILRTARLTPTAMPRRGNGGAAVLWALALPATALLVMRVVRSVRAPRVDVLESAILPPRAFRRWVDASSRVETGPVNEIPLDRFAGRGRGRRTAARVPGYLDREAKQVKRAPFLLPQPVLPTFANSKPDTAQKRTYLSRCISSRCPRNDHVLPHTSGARGVHAAVQKAGA